MHTFFQFFGLGWPGPARNGFQSKNARTRTPPKPPKIMRVVVLRFSDPRPFSSIFPTWLEKEEEKEEKEEKEEEKEEKMTLA